MKPTDFCSIKRPSWCRLRHLARVAGLLASVGLSLGTRGQPIVDVSEPPAPRPMAERLIAWHPIGSSSPHATNRHVGWGIAGRGWEPFVRLRVVPQLKLGIRRVMLHNPFGHEPLSEPMAFDQFVEARESGHTRITEGFVEAWKPVVEGFYTDGEPVEVICYVGSIDIDRDFLAIREGEPTGWSAAWMRRALDSIEPALAAGMSVGFDSSSDLPEDSAEFRLIQLIESLGHRCYIESRPIAVAPHLWRFPVVSTRRHWFRSDPDVHEGTEHNARNSDLTGEIIVLLNRIPDSGERLAELDRLLTETPYTVATRLDGGDSALRLRRWLQPSAKQDPAPSPTEIDE